MYCTKAIMLRTFVVFSCSLVVSYVNNLSRSGSLGFISYIEVNACVVREVKGAEFSVC
jgi:hypothetical protein